MTFIFSSSRVWEGREERSDTYHRPHNHLHHEMTTKTVGCNVVANWIGLREERCKRQKRFFLLLIAADDPIYV